MRGRRMWSNNSLASHCGLTTRLFGVIHEAVVATMCNFMTLTHLVPSEVLLDVPEPAEDPDVEQEERHEGDDARRDRPDPVRVHDDVRRVKAQAEIMKGLAFIAIEWLD